MSAALGELRARVAAARAAEDEARRVRQSAEDDLLAALTDVAGVSTGYSQHDGHRPAWLPTRLLFLRAWRQLRAEGHPGVTAHGKARVMSREAALAWRERTASEPRRRADATAPESGARSIGSEIDQALGIRLRGPR